MGIVDAIGLGIRKLYTEKKAMADFETIKKESGLKELDWNAVWESVSKYPAEVQTVLEAKNEDHVKLYDQDKQEIWKIQDETKQLLRDEVPELFWIDFFKYPFLQCLSFFPDLDFFHAAVSGIME